MGLFDRAKNAFGGGTDAWAAQAEAAQELANQHLKSAGYTDGGPVTMANAGAVSSQMRADHDVLDAYGQELNRIIAVGIPGTSVITGAVDTGDRTSGNPWFQIEATVAVPGQAPYTVSTRMMLAAQFIANYAIGTAHDVAVDPADPQNIALTS
jgi:hypothetical protein